MVLTLARRQHRRRHNQGSSAPGRRRSDYTSKIDALRMTNSLGPVAQQRQTWRATQVESALTKLVSDLQQGRSRHLVDGNIHDHFGAVLVDTFEQITNQPDVLGRVANRQAVRIFVDYRDGLRS